MAFLAPEKQLVVSVGISRTSYEEVLDVCRQWISQRKTSNCRKARYICVTSVHGIVMSHDDPEIAKIFNEADIATPDGMPIVWALRSFGLQKQQRVYGPSLMLELCRQAAENGHRIFLYGGRTDTLPTLMSRLREHFPSLEIAGSYSPPFRALSQREEQDIQRQIRESDADIVFVGIGAPKQEKWMYAHRHSFPGMILIGVGAAFDFHAGRASQAPIWIQQSGLEWLFRLMIEPRRLWKRYILITPRFLPLWAIQKWRSSRRACKKCMA